MANAELDAAVIARGGTVAIYASEGDEPLAVPVRPSMTGNVRYQFILVYTMPDGAKRRAVRDVSAAVSDGVLDVGEEAGLPLHRFPLERTGDAHAAVEAGAVGKVLIDVDVRSTSQLRRLQVDLGRRGGRLQLVADHRVEGADRLAARRPFTARPT